MAESGLVVPVPSATAAVAPWRERLDLVGKVHGVPAHVTVLYPFVPPDEIGPDDLHTLAEMFAAAAPFDFVLDRVAWFGESVVYLAPTPTEPFVTLTRRVVEQYPAHLPYAGAFDDVTPHLTVGDRGTYAELQDAAAAVAPSLPIAARATDVWLMVGTTSADSTTPRGDGGWRVRARFPLGGRGSR
ncbi:MAG: 2'-5' RNA ligase family protein [Acidimicrobiia bacterium]